MRLRKPFDSGEKLSPLRDGGLTAGAESMNRRQFAFGAGVAALCTTVAAVAEQAGDETGSRPDGLSPADWAETQARYQNLLRVYGARLSAAERKAILRVLINNQYMLASIQAFIVQNGDPSACTFRVLHDRSIG